MKNHAIASKRNKRRPMTGKRVSNLALGTAMAVIVFIAPAQPVRADDIDIYTRPVSGSKNTPAVMFTIDWRPNLASTACGGGACDFLTSKTYKDDGGVERNYLVLDAGGTTAYFNLLRAALKYVVQQVGDTGVRIGIALNHNQSGGASCSGPNTPTSGNNVCTNGGYIVAGATSMSTQAARDAFFAKLDAMPIPQGNAAHPYQGKELFFELFRYFSGQAPFNMKNGWLNWGTDKSYNINEAKDYSPENAEIPLSWDTSIIDTTTGNYISPVTDECVKLYTVNILFQVSQNEDDSDTDIKKSQANGGMAGIDISGNKNNFSTVIRWMYDNDVNWSTTATGKQNVTSFFIVDSSKNNSTTQSFAGAGVGIPSSTPYLLSENPETLITTLGNIFRNILSTSTTFVAPAVAVNVYNRSQVLNDVFIAMFQANDKGFPNWNGNLKKFTLGLNSTTGLAELQDVTGANAVAADGRVKYSALSYWTIAADLPAPGTNSDIIAGKDGRKVDRGGAGSKIPGLELKCPTTTDTSCWPGDYSPGLTNPTGDTTNVSSRKVFYDNLSIAGGLSALNADTSTASVLQSMFGAASAGTCVSSDTDTSSACNLILYARGAYYDTTGALKGYPWGLNDLLHSRPMAINYGARGSGSGYTASNPDVRVVAGSNDGKFSMYRNTKNNQSDPKTSNDTDGVETWAFVPTELMPLVKTLKENSGKTLRHPYGLDGTPALYMLDVDGDGNIDPGSCKELFAGKNYCDTVWVFFGLRRGGEAYYAMDVSDPDNPKLMWKITPKTDAKGNSSTDFAEMGQSWSTPRVVSMLYDGATISKPVLIFGGGYDVNKDTHEGHGSYTGTDIGTNDSVGNALFIVDAETGALVWKAVYDSSATTPSYNAATRSYRRSDLKDSIPSDVTAVDTDGNGLVDRVYVGDTGGVLWRFDAVCADQDGELPDGTKCDRGEWTMNPILSVGRHVYGQSSLADDRRFFYAPAYQQSKDDAGDFDAVVIGTGDRENPLDTKITNWIYMYKDRSTSSGIPPSTTLPDTDLTDVTCSGSNEYNCATVGSNGWRMELECPGGTSSSCGEKHLSNSVILGSSVFINTYVPAGGTGACGLSEGIGFMYQLNLADAAAVYDYDATNNTANRTLFRSDRWTQLDSPGIPSEVVSLGGGKFLRPDLKVNDANLKSGYKAYWYEKNR